MSPKTLGDAIKVKRYEHGLSCMDIAAQLGVAASLVKSWEEDLIMPHEGARKALAIILGLAERPLQIENPT